MRIVNILKSVLNLMACFFGLLISTLMYKIKDFYLLTLYQSPHKRPWWLGLYGHDCGEFRSSYSATYPSLYVIDTTWRAFGARPLLVPLWIWEILAHLPSLSWPDADFFPKSIKSLLEYERGLLSLNMTMGLGAHDCLKEIFGGSLWGTFKKFSHKD